MGEKAKRETCYRKAKIQPAVKQNRYNETTRILQISSRIVRLSLRLEEEEEKSGQDSKRLAKKIADQTIERTDWIKDFVKQLVGVALIVVKEHEHNASLGREPVISAKDWRILRLTLSVTNCHVTNC